MPARSAQRIPTQPETAAPTTPQPPADLAPWRTIAALADTLNAGSAVQSFTVHGIRHYIYMAESGRAPDLLPFIRRIGRKVLISEQGFLYWLETRPSVRP